MCTPGSRGDGTAHPATLVSAARGCNRLRGPSPALLTSAAQRPRAPAATRSSRTPRPARSTGRARAAPAAGPPPRSPGPRVAPPAPRGPKTAESAAPRGPGTSRQRELGTRGDPEARGLGAGEPEAPGRPLKPASPRWPAMVGGSRVSVPAPAAAVSDARQIPVPGAHRSHAASRPSVPSSRSRHRIPKFPQVQRAD